MPLRIGNSLIPPNRKGFIDIYMEVINMALEKKNVSSRERGIGNVIAHLRYINQMTVKELAEVMQVAPTYVCDVEANRKRPSLDMLDRFSKALGVSKSTIIYFDEQGQKKNYDHQEMLWNILKKLNESQQI